ncbi:MAG: hypothetical protein A2X36_17070 [Elusimicrobia bacterium GWA2_69_24]|nr:MAG: hypothetical protein A2X36_17070 [Elusimicrobia bacterium GWA2_69_24]
MSPKVMIADDESQIHLVLRSMLKAGSYRIQDAYNGAQVLEGVRSDPPDLILLDVNMPDKSGLKVLEELRCDPKTRDMHVVLMSGDPTVRQRARTLAVAVDDCIAKPFDPDGLKARLEQVLGRSAPARPASQPVTDRPVPGADVTDALIAMRGRIMELDRKVSAADKEALKYIQALHERLRRIEKERAVPAGSGARRLLPLTVSAAALALLLVALQFQKAPPAAVPVGAPIVPAAPAVPAVPVARVVIPAGPLPAGPGLQSVRVQSFRVSFVTSQPVAARAFLGPRSGDLFVDLPGVVTRLPGDVFRGRGSMIRGVRTARAQFEGGPGVRSRIYLRGAVGYKLSTVGNRTILDIYYGGRKFI